MKTDWFSLPDFALSFSSILLQATPFLLLGALVSACVDLLLPEKWLASWMNLSRHRGILFGCLAGFFFPICECGAMPAVRRLIQKGVPLHLAGTYLFASPILNPLCLLSTWMAFRVRDPWLMVGLRTLGGVLLVVVLGWVMSRRKPEQMLRTSLVTDGKGHDPDCGHGHHHNHENCCAGEGESKARRFLHTLTHDFIGVMFYLTLGAAFAALLNTSLNRTALQPILQHPFWAPVAAVGLAQALCLCSTTDAFIAAAFPQLSLAATLAFLVAGPLFDFKLFWIYQAIFRRRFVLLIGWIVTAGALIFAWSVSLWR